MEKNDLEPISANQLKLDLFGLDPLLDKNYSNTLEIYDLAGKFLYSKQHKYMKRASAEETEFTRTTVYRKMEINVSVTAANIERIKDGKKQRIFVFPGAREEVIEDVLRKFATERRAEAYEITTGSEAGTKLVGVGFSLYEVYEELKRVGKTYSYAEIREAIEIMNRSMLTFLSSDGSIDLSAPFFPIKLVAEKGKKKDTRSFICFHPMVTEAILTLNFRRYNYSKALGLNKHYSRLTYKRLCHRWTQAAPDKPYTILLSTLIKAMKEPYANLYQDKALFVEVFDDLMSEKANVLERYVPTPKKDGLKIIDWKFELYPTNAFAKQQAANNKVENQNKGIETSNQTDTIDFDDEN